MHVFDALQVAQRGSCRNSLEPQWLACRALKMQRCSALQIEPERPAALCKQQVSKALSLALVLRDVETPRCCDAQIDKSAQTCHRHAHRQTACRQQMMFQTYEQTSLPPPPFYCAQAEVRLAPRPRWWAVAHSFRRQKGCTVRVCLADHSVLRYWRAAHGVTSPDHSCDP